MKLRIPRQSLPLLATVVVCGLLYVAACLAFERFFSLRVFASFFNNNAFLGIVAVGMTFVILSGGIDLSVGSMIGCCTILLATLVTTLGLHPLVAMALVVLAGLTMGCAAGSLIALFRLPPFLVTLGGMFFARGVGLLIGRKAIAISHPFHARLAEVAIPLPGGAGLDLPAVVFLAIFAVAVYLARFTRFGRNTYAVGGNEDSAGLMGLPVVWTKVRIYALSGFCSSLAAVVYTISTPTGDPLAGMGLELDAIAAVVVGGTLLAGGTGWIEGTLFGLLIFAIIQEMLKFYGKLDPGWARVAVGILLLAFVLLQRIIQRKRRSA